MVGGFGLQNVDSGFVPFTFPPGGTWYLSLVATEHDAGPNNGGYSPRDYVNFAGPLVVVPSAALTALAVEYHHASFDHYFITPNADEITILDSGVPPFQEWSRTGASFKVYVHAGAPLGSIPTCRFFNDSPAFAPRSSHFYAPIGLGCEDILNSFKDWKLEDPNLFNTYLPDLNGNCPGGTIPIYRLYNNGQGGSPNHRFVTTLSQRQFMITKGYIPEGNGIGVGMCAPQ